MNTLLNAVKWNADGLVTAIIQDAETKGVLMCAYMNLESLRKTLESGKCWYYSRSRQKLWLKGESSGHQQFVKEIRIDCDGDALLFLVEQRGGACHVGYRSCFFRKDSENNSEGEWDIVSEKMFDPDQVYKK